MEPLGSFDATGMISGLIPVTSASLSAASLMTIVITAVIEAIADLVVPDFHPGFVILRLACSSPTDQLCESVHLSSQEIAFRCAPSSIAHRLMLYYLDESHWLAVGWNRCNPTPIARGRDAVHLAPPFRLNRPHATIALMCLHPSADNSVSVRHYCFPCIKSVSWIHGKTSKTDRR
jgi:hypothetical protein